jgi:cytoplasmic iron level regulating protein YaaA (DUF328/UPF0246 family)
MLIAVLSPAKRIRTSALPTDLPHTLPRQISQAKILAKRAKRLDHGDLQRLMSISTALAEQCHSYFRRFSPPFDLDNARHAIKAFNGDTYLGFEADSLSDEVLDYAQDHVRILSGLYGLVRPLDLIQPYRLEMGTKMDNPRGSDLYEFWGKRIAKQLDKDAAELGGATIINVASAEYFKAIDQAALKSRIITPVFKEIRGGMPKVMAFHAKRARGMMARYIVQNKIENAADLADFNMAGYRFRPEHSGSGEMQFHRVNEKELAIAV